MANDLRVIAHADGTFTLVLGRNRTTIRPNRAGADPGADRPPADSPPAPPRPPIGTNPNDDTFIGFVLALETSPDLGGLVFRYMAELPQNATPRIRFESGSVSQPALDWATDRLASDFPGLRLTLDRPSSGMTHGG